MSIPMSIYRSEINEYDDSTFLDRIVHCIGNKELYSTLIALSTPVNAARVALVNKCKEKSKNQDLQNKLRTLFWIPPFNAWNMLSIGNLSLALLWHIYKSLPENIISDEKIMYKLGKISVTLPAMTNLFKNTSNYHSMDSEHYTLLFNNTIPPDKKSSVSSIFSVCDQINELSEAFLSISKQISTIGNFDSLVIPVLDMDLCFPDQAISLLFAIKNFMCCEHISFIIVSDTTLLSSALKSIYNSSLSSEQSNQILFSLFDDWIRLPSPSINNILQSLNNKIILREKEHIITFINKSGIIPLLPDVTIIHYSLNRFNSFIKSIHEKFSSEEYGFVAILFLIGTSYPNEIKKIALFPDLKQFIKKLRTLFKNQNGSTKDKQNTRSSTNSFLLQPSSPNAIASEFPLSYFEIIYKDNKIVSSLFSIIPSSLSDLQVGKLLNQIIPFL
jgi:hypothetical protein